MCRSSAYILGFCFLTLVLEHSAKAQSWKKVPLTDTRYSAQKADDLAAGGKHLAEATAAVDAQPELSQALLEELRMLDAIAQDLGVEVDELLVESELLRDMQDLRELQRLMEDLQQAFQFPEMQGGLPGDENPDVASLGQGVMGDGTSLEDLLFGHQGPRWDGVGMDVESFGGGTQGNRRYPSAEPGPSGSATPDITPRGDRCEGQTVTSGKKSFERNGSAVCVVFDTYADPDNPSIRTTIADIYINGELRAQGIWESSSQSDWSYIFDLTEEPDLWVSQEYIEQSFCDPRDEQPDDSQPNPEGDGAGGPAGGQRELLDWLTGRPPKAGNQALNRPIGKMDVLGQPGAGEARYRSSSPTRFSRMRYDINPAMRRGATERAGTTWCPPVDPDDPARPINPLGPAGPGGPSPVK